MLVLGVDTLEFGLEVQDYELNFRPFLDTFRVLKESAQETGVEQETSMGDLSIKVHSSGIRFYAYRLTCEDFSICFAEKLLPNNAPIFIRFMSSYLWSYGVREAFDRFMRWFQVFGVDVSSTKVSRVDICADSDTVSFVPSDGNDFITRAKGRSRHGVDDEHSEGKLFTGFTIGRGQPMLARIYLKGLEVKKSGKTWFYNVWALHGWEGDAEVWRVEFQLRRGILKELGVNTIDELLDRLDGIWAYCTKEWLTLRRSNGQANVSRREVRRKWALIQSAKFRELTSPLVRQKVCQGNITQLLNQAAGLSVSIAALGDHRDLDSTLEILGNWVEERMRKKNTSFNGEKTIRRERFLR